MPRINFALSTGLLCNISVLLKLYEYFIRHEGPIHIANTSGFSDKFTLEILHLTLIGSSLSDGCYVITYSLAYFRMCQVFNHLAA